jgi:3-oxoacyl-[acyl-carrier protein] reductase
METRDVVAVVTGAASGLGYTFAWELARAGASVAAGDVHEEGLERLVEETAGFPGRVVTARLDVSQEPSVKAFVKEAFEHLPGINTLVNNAGVLMDGLLVDDQTDWVKRLPLGLWRKVLDVNLTGAFLVAREVAAEMLERKTAGGLIVNVSSLARGGNAGQSAYAASKAGLDAATRSWAMELGPKGIRVAGIAPGVVETPMIDNISDDARADLLSQVLVGRFGRPEEIWLALKFVVECEFFSGRVVAVDGGARMG